MNDHIKEARKPRRLEMSSAPNIFILIVALWKRFGTSEKQFLMNHSRYILDNFRNPSVVVAKFVQKAFMGLFLGGLYLQMKRDQVRHLQ